jgi:hypothetical protein
VGITHQALVGMCQQVRGRGVAAMTQVQHHVLGQGIRAVGVAGGVSQRDDVGDLAGVEPVDLSHRVGGV